VSQQNSQRAAKFIIIFNRRPFFVIKAFKISFIFLLFSLYTLPVTGQNLRVNSLYTSADVSSIESGEMAGSTAHPEDITLEDTDIPFSIDKLSEYFEHTTVDQQETARKIFLWIAWNIDYDQQAMENRQPLDYTPEAVLSDRKSLCLGFAELFKVLCQESGLNARTIQGFAKGSGAEKDIEFQEHNHAWNGIMINEKWYLADVSWASTIRSQIEKENKLAPGMANQYLLQYFKPVPEHFILTHLPEDPFWQLTPRKVTIGEFQSDGELIREKLALNGGRSSIDYEKSIAAFDELDSLDRVIAYMERMVELPTNNDREYGLGIAYYYKAQELAKSLNPSSGQRQVAQIQKIGHYYKKALDELAKVMPTDDQYAFALTMQENIQFKLETLRIAPVF